MTVFKPKHLTFNFSGTGYRPRNLRRLSLGGRNSDQNKPITHSTVLSFLDFIDVFKSFALRSRKDLKDLFDQFAPSQPSIEKKLDKNAMYVEPLSKDTGLITRNSVLDLSLDPHRKQLCDALAVASIVANSTGLDMSKQKCLGLQELQEFLEDHQEEDVNEQDLIHIIQVNYLYCLLVF